MSTECTEEVNYFILTSVLYLLIHFVSDLTYMVNPRGRMVMVYEDNIFHVNRRYEGTTFWQCSDYRKYQCKCRCTTTADGTVRRSTVDHTHPSHIQKIRSRMHNLDFITTDVQKSWKKHYSLTAYLLWMVLCRIGFNMYVGLIKQNKLLIQYHNNTYELLHFE